MPDFTATRTYLYVAGNIISPTQNTTNETGIYTPHNAAFNASSGHTHSASTGDGPRIRTFNPASRIYVGASTTLLAGDVVIGVDHTAAKTVEFATSAPNAYERFVTVYDYTGNAGLYPITINFTGGWTLNTALTSVQIVEDFGSLTFHYDLVRWNIVAGS